MTNNELIAVIVEGAAETAILELLLANNLLIFKQSDLLENELIRSRSASNFQRQHLALATKQKIHIYRILDSRKERFKLSPAYLPRISKIDSLYTRPEIEVLYIINENKYAAFKKSGLTAHDFVNSKLTKMPKGHIKTHAYVYQYWQKQLNCLVKAIQRYAELTTDDFSQTLAFILKQ